MTAKQSNSRAPKSFPAESITALMRLTDEFEKDLGKGTRVE